MVFVCLFVSHLYFEENFRKYPIQNLIINRNFNESIKIWENIKDDSFSEIYRKSVVGHIQVTNLFSFIQKSKSEKIKENRKSQFTNYLRSNYFSMEKKTVSYSTPFTPLLYPVKDLTCHPKSKTKISILITRDFEETILALRCNYG